MTSSELNLFKEMLREIVRNVVTEEVTKIMKDQSKKDYSKDLKEIKLLVGKQILEGRKAKASGTRSPLREDTREGLSGLVNKRMPMTRSRNPLVQSIQSAPIPQATKDILSETAVSMLPEDFDDLQSGPDENGTYNADDMSEGESYDVSDEYAHQVNVTEDPYAVDEEYESNVPAPDLGAVFKLAQQKSAERSGT